MNMKITKKQLKEMVRKAIKEEMLKEEKSLKDDTAWLVKYVRRLHDTAKVIDIAAHRDMLEEVDLEVFSDRLHSVESALKVLRVKMKR